MRTTRRKGKWGTMTVIEYDKDEEVTQHSEPNCCGQRDAEASEPGPFGTKVDVGGGHTEQCEPFCDTKPPEECNCLNAECADCNPSPEEKTESALAALSEKFNEVVILLKATEDTIRVYEDTVRGAQLILGDQRRKQSLLKSEATVIIDKLSEALK